MFYSQRQKFFPFVVGCADFCCVQTQIYLAKIVRIPRRGYSKRQLFLSFTIESCDELRFIFTSPTFVAEKTQKERKELTDEKSESYKAGYKTICEIGEERIRCAGKKIREETGADIDYGFRVLRVDSSNMKDVYYKPSDYIQEQIFEAYSPKTQRKVL